MPQEVLIRAEQVSKRFCRDLKRSLWYGVQDIAHDLCGGNGAAVRLRRNEFWAVEDASFELRRGECLGLIGRNGAGKTTLLKMLNGLVKPDAGRISLYGSVGGLIALGAGFSPVLTGRENTFINGAVLGKSRREVASRLDEIIDFAELGEFIDAPVQSYSSGMQVRLGFAIAAVLVQPDILLLDEVLAVGDMGFTIKCLNKVRELAQNSAVVFVSHSMPFVSSFCNRILCMQGGRVECDSPDLAEGIDFYMRQFPTEENLSGSGEARISNVKIHSHTSSEGNTCECLARPGESLRLTFDLDIDAEISRSTATLVLRDHTMRPIIAFPIVGYGNEDYLAAGHHALASQYEKVDVAPGNYSFVIVISDSATMRVLARLEGTAPFRVVGSKVPWASLLREASLSRREGPIDSSPALTHK